MTDLATTEVSLLQQRLLQVVAYLDAVVSRTERPVRTLAADRTVTGDQIPAELPGCQLYPGEDWLQLVKIADPRAITIPDDLDSLVHPVRHDPSSEPGLNPDWSALAAEAGFDPEAVSARHEDWLSSVWRPWAERTREARRVTQAYNRVRQLALELERQESELEIVWGHGMVHCTIAGERVQHPLVTTAVEIVVDPETGRLAVRPTGPTRLEIHALTGLPSQALDDILATAGVGGVVAFDPIEDDARTEFFARALMALGHQPRVRRPGDGPIHPQWANDLWVDDTFAVTLRPRFSNLRGFLADLQRHATAGGALEFTGLGALAAVLSEEPGSLTDPGDPAETWTGSGTRLLMPLETNGDQEKIARELAAKKLLAVQGPPGTGKTHTIANLISHLVAHGKRVLVVAHKEEPLAEVRDRIPAGLRDLSVALIGASAAQVNQMQAAVRQLTGIGSPTEAPAAQANVARIAEALDTAITQRGRLEAALRKLSDRDRSTLEIDGLELRPLQVGEWLNGRPGDSWLPDRIPHRATCPLTPSEIDELLTLARGSADADRVNARMHLPGLDPLRAGTNLAALHAEQDRLAAVEQDVLGKGLRKDTRHHTAEAFTSLSDQCRDLAASIINRAPWLTHLAASAANPATRDAYAAQTTALQHDLDQLATLSMPLAGHQVTVDGAQVATPREHLQILAELGQMLRVRGSVGMFQRDLKRAQTNNLVDGEPLRNGSDVNLVIATINVQQLRQSLALRWNQLATQHGAPSIASAYPEQEVTANLAALNRCIEEETETLPKLSDDLGRVFKQASLPAGVEGLQTAAGILAAATALPDLRRVERDLVELRTALRAGASQPNSSALWERLQQALETRDWTAWDAALAEANRLRELTGTAIRCEELSTALRAIAPKLTVDILSGEGRPIDAMDLERAWRWRSISTWLDDVIGTEDAAALGEAANSARGEIRRLTEQLAQASARAALITGMTQQQRRALADWATAIGKIGKGTGKNAGHWTAVAQQKMQDAVEGVPVWIMSWQRALSQFRGGTTPFDVVIVDEASQCDIRSLLVLTLARRGVVVGDDKQISPTSFARTEEVRDLIDRHLAGIPSANFFEPGESLFNRAVSASDGALTLSEHFRCVPEIIQFCNRWYDERIQPLRAGAGAFAEPLQVVHTPEGIRAPHTSYGNAVNKPEADALIEKLVALTRDPAYDGKTFGVISLLSSSKQEVYLQHQLLQRLGEREYARRQMKVGGAYAFQGAERDVMFVSLVVDSNRPFGAFTSADDQRRVNVAASRARDQVWIFHSAELNDFSKDDIRRAWIEYATSGFDAATRFDDLEELCESDFERDVLRQMLERGYSPIPQFRVGKYRIDFVILLQNGSRIAIECDGDAYHQDLDADMARQAILERVGRCEFFRVRGSVYGRDPVGSLAPLWKLLEQRRADQWQPPLQGARNSAVDGALPARDLVEPDSSSVDADCELATDALAVSHGRSPGWAARGHLRDDSGGRPATVNAELTPGSMSSSSVPTSDVAAAVTAEQRAALQLAIEMGMSVRITPDGTVEIAPSPTVLTGPSTTIATAPSQRGPVADRAPWAQTSPTGARAEILAAARAIAANSIRGEFTASQILEYLSVRGTPYAEGTIKVMVSSHLFQEGYFERVDRGVYRLAST